MIENWVPKCEMAQYSISMKSVQILIQAQQNCGRNQPKKLELDASNKNTAKANPNPQWYEY